MTNEILDEGNGNDKITQMLLRQRIGSLCKNALDDVRE